MDNALPLRKSFTLSVLFHAALLVVLLITIIISPKPQPLTSLNLRQADKIVEAVSVNQAQVEQEMQNIQKQQAQQEAAQKAQVMALKQQAIAAAKQKQQQEQQLAQLKIQQQQMVQQQQAELTKLQQQQQAAQKQLAMAQQQTTAKQKQLQQEAKKALQQQLNQDATQLNKQQDQQTNSELAKYTALILQAISQQWIVPANANRTAYCILEIRLAPNGNVSNVQLRKSSGDVALDQSAINAVYKASPLPVPSDPALFNRMQDIQLKVQPQDISG